MLGIFINDTGIAYLFFVISHKEQENYLKHSQIQHIVKEYSRMLVHKCGMSSHHIVK